MYVFIFLGKEDNFGVFEEIFGDFWDCDDYVGLGGGTPVRKYSGGVTWAGTDLPASWGLTVPGDTTE